VYNGIVTTTRLSRVDSGGKFVRRSEQINYQLICRTSLRIAKSAQYGCSSAAFGEAAEGTEGSIQLTVLRTGVFSTQQLIPHGLELPRPESQTET
jgi:hypothetical protein